MSNLYNKDYFLNAKPNIIGNSLLREPQIFSYSNVFLHFVRDENTSDAIVVLPTGVGKTGVIGLLPYGICKGRLLIITPQVTIRETVIDSLDPDNIDNFWLKRKVFKDKNDLPVLIEFTPDLPLEILESANIIVLNIHKMQSRYLSSPINNLPPDFFDLIIIDEAHHSTANTWVESTNYFSNAKVVKLTGTPIRTDGEKLAGTLVYRYQLSQAMLNNYVKSLRNIEYIPDDLTFILDNDYSKKYTYNELLNLNLRDEEWIRRSVAYSKECSQHVVDSSIKLLNEKKSLSKVPHKIIAVACTVEHAIEIKQLYIDKGLKAEVIYSALDKFTKAKIKSDIENHRLDVIVHVNMLGEGYDHPYLSIGAIFRPYSSSLPYEQFIGRILRVIPSDEVNHVIDNIADIVSHKYLLLDELWAKYKKELEISEIIKNLQEINEININDTTSGGEGNRENLIGKVNDNGNGNLSEDAFLTTKLIKTYKQKKEEEEKKISELQALLPISYDEASKILRQLQTKETESIKRPDLFFYTKSKDVDNEIKVNIVPELITMFNIDQYNDNLKTCSLFNGKYQWIANKNYNNGAMLAIYFSDYLKRAINKPKSEWDTPDCIRALELLPKIKEYVINILDNFVNI